MTTLTKDPQFPAYVWEAPVRLWHWIMALSLVVLVVTGFLVGSPPASVHGEASASFLFGYIRFTHFAAGYIFTFILVYRIAWAFMGNRYSREIFTVPIQLLKPSYWGEIFGQVKYYMFIGKARHYVGHNPLASVAMFGMYFLGSIFMIVTGFALYGEGLGRESWMFRTFTSWVVPLFGQSQDVHTWHRLGMYLLIWFSMVHMYMAIRDDLTSGLTTVKSMVNGWRRPKDV